MKRRILVVVLSFILTSFIVFSLSSSIEGSAGYALLGDDASDEALSAVEDVLGINRPFPIRYLSFLCSFFTLSWGRTIDGELVFDAISNSFHVTLALSMSSFLIALSIGVLFSLLDSSVKRPRFVFTVSYAFFSSIPSFVLAIVFVIAGVSLGYKVPSFQVDGLDALSIPSLVLGILLSFQISRNISFHMRKERSSFYNTGMVSRGLGDFGISIALLKPAIYSSLPVIVESFATLLSGSAVMEGMFSLPGIGSLVVSAALRRDVPLLSTILMLVSLAISVLYILVDVLSGVLDRRRGDAR